MWTVIATAVRLMVHTRSPSKNRVCLPVKELCAAMTDAAEAAGIAFPGKRAQPEGNVNRSVRGIPAMTLKSLIQPPFRWS